MKRAAVSELKAKLAKYLRLVKSGEVVEITERGLPVAILRSVRAKSESISSPPRRDPGALAKMKFSTKPKADFDVVAELIEERRKR